MSKLRLIAGLGNPGAKYDKTRHNAGFMLVDALSDSLGIPFDHSEKNGVWGKGKIRGKPIILFKPQLYMNRSGQSLFPFLSSQKIHPSEMLVIYDDMDLELGSLRIRKKGSSGGHNGIASIIETVGTAEFCRLKIGIGRPNRREKVIDYVLSSFSENEWLVWEDTLKTACDAVILSVVENVLAAMNKFNSTSKNQEEAKRINAGTS